MSVCAKFQLSSSSRSAWKVCVGWVGGWGGGGWGLHSHYIVKPNRCVEVGVLTILIRNVRARSARVRMFWWHLPIMDVRPGEFQPYVWYTGQYDWYLWQYMYDLPGMISLPCICDIPDNVHVHYTPSFTYLMATYICDIPVYIHDVPGYTYVISLYDNIAWHILSRPSTAAGE